MTKAQDQLHKAAEDFVARVRAWWQRTGEIGRLDPDERNRIAADLGVTTRDLEDLAARGPNAADLLYQRLAALGLTGADAERTALGLMRDLQRTCSCCDQKGTCAQDLSSWPDDPVWKEYCPNAITLDAVARSKGRFPA